MKHEKKINLFFKLIYEIQRLLELQLFLIQLQ